MSLSNDTELANTRAKLALLEQRYDALRSTGSGGCVAAGAGDRDHVREVTARSLRATINQFREEIARYEARRQPARP